MKRQRIFAVLTGDLVKSASYQSLRGEILNRLRDIFASARKFKKDKYEFIIFSNIYRGDSFQGIVSRASVSLKVALYIRSELLKILIGKEQTEARIAIGLGTIYTATISAGKDTIEGADGQCHDACICQAVVDLRPIITVVCRSKRPPTICSGEDLVGGIDGDRSYVGIRQTIVDLNPITAVVCRTVCPTIRPGEDLVGGVDSQRPYAGTRQATVDLNPTITVIC